MTIVSTNRCNYLARARREGEVIAESNQAIRVDHEGLPAVLWFPRDVVLPGVLEDTELVHGGEADLEDYVSFAAEQITIELIDTRDGDDERDITVKRFPNWGDAADLFSMLDVVHEEDNRYSGAPRQDWRRGVVEGGQMLGQTLVAAGRHYPGRRAVSANMLFARAANAAAPLTIELDEAANGRTFTGLSVRVSQAGRTCAVGTLLLDHTAPDLIRHAVSAPDVAGPYESVPYDMSVTGRDLRIVDNAYTNDPDAPLGPPVLDAWVRWRDVPDDPYIHVALLTEFTGHMSIAAAMRPHAGIGQSQAHRTISTAVNAITLSLHADVHADQWLLYHHESTFAGDGMTHSQCRVHTEDGALVASFTVEAMVRAFNDPGAARDTKQAL